MTVEWDRLITEYRVRTGTAPQRIYLHPADYHREQVAYQAYLVERPESLTPPESDALLAGVPVHITPLVPEGTPLLWPPQGRFHA